MPIHDHRERVGTPTVRASGDSPSSTAQLDRVDHFELTAGELALGAAGWLLLGAVIAWSISRVRVRRLQAHNARLAKRWARAAERFETAKEVIARMVNQESERASASGSTRRA